MNRLRFLPVLAVLLAVPLWLAGASIAGPGVGVNLGSIVVNSALAPGGAYDLAEVGVINLGDEAADFTFSVTHMSDQSELRPPGSWFHFEPGVFKLAPGQARSVSLRLVLPTGARSGSYYAHIEAHPAATDGVVGVAAATRVTFTVKESTWLDAQRNRLNRWLDQYQVWFLGAATIVVASIAINSGRKRFRLRLPIERR